MELKNAIISSVMLLLLCWTRINAFTLSTPFQRRNMLLKSLNAAAPYEAIKQQIFQAVEAKSDKIPPSIKNMLVGFMNEYTDSSIKAAIPPEKFQYIVGSFIKHVDSALKQPYQFSPYHKSIREPFDYYAWGNDFMRTLIIEEQSQLLGKEQFEEIDALSKQGDNVWILSNHQTEADPQVISILLEKHGLSHLAEKMVFIAGHKVTNDPVAIPFSMGRNLICIHSKKHIKNPPEDYPKKQQQNLETMAALSGLMQQGGNVFWVAPSGGRDRPNENGKFVVAPFDYKALDMFKLIAMQSGKGCHFFPLAMYTHQLIPPPKTVSSELGESRSAQRGPVSIHLLPQTNGIGKLKDKVFTEEIQKSVEAAYEGLYQHHNPQ